MDTDCVIESINGSVQSQGIKVAVEGWLAIGSGEWEKTPDEVKALAYQAAKATGWTDKALIAAITRKWQHIDEHMMMFVIDSLQDLAKTYPAVIETKN